jgi:glycosyltransferase involved in cell wall biosynthesis
MKRTIAQQFSFGAHHNKQHTARTIRIARSGLITKEAALETPCYFQSPETPNHKPRVSIITSVYKGDEFIEGFLADIVQQTIFKETELIIINAHSPGNEEPIILSYCEQYPNIVYERLEKDPGLYATWNYAIKMARADLITNANVDDRRKKNSLEEQATELEKDASVDLVYAGVYVSYCPNETFDNNTCYWVMSPQDFSARIMYACLPGPMPMWRTLLHEKYGFFDESYRSAGDFEFWNRLALNGVQFKKIPGITGLFYQNPEGLSTNQDAHKVHERSQENARIRALYSHMWT